MKIQMNVNLIMIFCLLSTIISSGNAFAQDLHVDSITVDSVWNSDSSFYDNNGILQNRQSRDAVVSFKPIGFDSSLSLTDSFAISIDSAKTWNPSPNPILKLSDSSNNTINHTCHSKLRVFGGDRPNVAFKVTVYGNIKPVQLLQPIGGTFKVGQPVSIQWKINDSTQVAYVMIKMSIDSGQTFPIVIGDRAFSIETTSISWTPTIDQVSSKCVIELIEYMNFSIYDKSGIFVVDQ
jgi:hypothetical protein